MEEVDEKGGDPPTLIGMRHVQCRRMNGQGDNLVTQAQQKQSLSRSSWSQYEVNLLPDEICNDLMINEINLAFKDNDDEGKHRF